MASSGVPPAVKTRVTPRQMMPMQALVSGPTNAIRNSLFALGGLPRIWDTPPSAKSVISRTGTPYDLITSEWASSCSRRMTKKRIPLSSAMRRTAGPVH